MDGGSTCASAKEEGELEDGEIFDDEPQQQQQRQQPARPTRRPRPGKRARVPGGGGGPGPPLSGDAMPLNMLFPAVPRPPFECTPRSGFWERSHGALGLFRYRGYTPDRSREWMERPPESLAERTDSPLRKHSAGVRGPLRRPFENPPKADSKDESFEDLLQKYKQIQLELECIRKEERMALKDERELAQEVLVAPAADLKEKKMFQSFSIRSLRMKLLKPAEGNVLNCTLEEDGGGAGEDGVEPDGNKSIAVKDEESDLSISVLSEDASVAHVKDEEDDLSELQLRLLALQSASRKWQQKEQQVLMKSKEKISKTDKNSPACDRGKTPERARLTRANKPHLSKQAWRKQQLRMWKLQQQRQQRQKQEEEERRKREEEIRKIRDLSNQDEQYNRFMKLVGFKHQSCNKSSNGEQKKLAKQSLDTLGNLYQYDNYEEVAMDTDSETNSTAASPTRDALSMFPLESTPQRQGSGQHFLQRFAAPPPLPTPPHPDDTQQPPKPPLADEEEEEEMLLREELLKSLVSKRTVQPEAASSNSGPPSPLRTSAQPNNNIMAVGLNAAMSRPHKFVRRQAAHKAPFVLPRHKSVVVRLTGSDDSDSEGESCDGAAQKIFSGLEFMIKEARRTVEATKPKHLLSEKENNPVKCIEDAKERRLLNDDMASLEKKCGGLEFMMDVHSSVSEMDVMGRAVGLQNKITRHKALLSKDEALLKQLQLQEMKKRESLKVAESKVVRLKEQLLAAEKIVSANRVLLKKLQEQVQKVQYRVAIKSQQSVMLQQDLAKVISLTAPAILKPKTSDAIKTVKHPSAKVPDSQYLDLIAQKKHLQQLESEYALKIQKLKKVQALRQAESSSSAPPAGSAVFPLPQPSVHDLTQDKLILSSEEIEAEESEQIPAAASKSRRSFVESGSCTKPKLSHLDQSGPSKQAKASTCATAGLPDLLPGLNMDDLRKRYQLSGGLSQLMQEHMSSDDASLDHEKSQRKIVQIDLESTAACRNSLESKPHLFTPYHSPLLAFKSYRFSPYYRTKEKLSILSVTYSNTVDPKKRFCRFDLNGTCNDDECPWQHMRNCTLEESDLFQDILSYSLPLIHCVDTSSDSDISSATQKYVEKLFGASKVRMGTDQKAVLLVSKVNESLRHVPPFTTYKAQRKWKPEEQRVKENTLTHEDQYSVDVTLPHSRVQERCLSADVCVTREDSRYFDSETDDISNLETSVLESPNNVQLWIKLAFRYLNQKDVSVSECLDAALNTLSRALEDNCEQAELWCHYLLLFSRRGSREEVQEMCEMALDHVTHYDVWWTYLGIESSFQGKDEVCGRLISSLLERSEDVSPDLRSFQLLESLMFRVQLNVFTGRQQNALHLLKSTLDAKSEQKVLAVLTLADRCVLWLSYIHMTEFRCLPPCLFDPANSNPSRIVCREPFLIAWRASQSSGSSPDAIISLFQDALHQCADEGVASSEQIQACFLLHSNLIHFYRHLDRCQEAVSFCERILEKAPLYWPLLEIAVKLHLSSGHTEKAIDVWSRVHTSWPDSAVLFYHLFKSLHSQGKCSVTEQLFDKFVYSFCESKPDQMTSIDVLRTFLGVATRDLANVPTFKAPRDPPPYLHLVHCCWQSVYGCVREAVDAFEKALGGVTQLDLLHNLWLDYLSFARSKLVGKRPGARELQMFGGLLHRCLETVPTRLLLPLSSSQYWDSFGFHNRVISFYLASFPQTQHSVLLERLQYNMPRNINLAVRLLLQEWRDGNLEHFKMQSRLLCSSNPSSLATWNIAIAVEKEQKRKAEVQQLFSSSLQKLPLCASLWRDCLLFEAAKSANTDTLKKIIDKCQEAGVSLTEPLGLSPDLQRGKEQ